MNFDVYEGFEKFITGASNSGLLSNSSFKLYFGILILDLILIPWSLFFSLFLQEDFNGDILIGEESGLAFYCSGRPT